MHQRDFESVAIFGSLLGGASLLLCGMWIVFGIGHALIVTGLLLLILGMFGITA